MTVRALAASAGIVAAALCGCQSGNNAATADAGPPVMGGSGSVSGSVDARPYYTVGSAYVIGKPDDPANTVVIYVFDNAIACGDISSPGWDQRITDQTQSLELKLIGKSPGIYPVAARPSTGQSTDNYTLTSTSGTPSEMGASSGTVSLGSLVDGAGANGTFDLTFPGGSLSGSFDAIWCAAGSEP